MQNPSHAYLCASGSRTALPVMMQYYATWAQNVSVRMCWNGNLPLIKHNCTSGRTHVSKRGVSLDAPDSYQRHTRVDSSGRGRCPWTLSSLNSHVVHKIYYPCVVFVMWYITLLLWFVEADLLCTIWKQVCIWLLHWRVYLTWFHVIKLVNFILCCFWVLTYISPHYCNIHVMSECLICLCVFNAWSRLLAPIAAKQTPPASRRILHWRQASLEEQCMELVACKQYSGGLRSSLVAFKFAQWSLAFKIGDYGQVRWH